jgi:hypothetical protein
MWMLADSINNNDNAISDELACKEYYRNCESFVLMALTYQGRVEEFEGIRILEELLLDNDYA